MQGWKLPYIYTLVERLLGHWATSRIIAASDNEREFMLKLGLTNEDRSTVLKYGIDDQTLDYFAESDTCETLN